MTVTRWLQLSAVKDAAHVEGKRRQCWIRSTAGPAHLNVREPRSSGRTEAGQLDSSTASTGEQCWRQLARLEEITTITLLRLARGHRCVISQRRQTDLHWRTESGGGNRQAQKLKCGEFKLHPEEEG